MATLRVHVLDLRWAGAVAALALLSAVAALVAAGHARPAGAPGADLGQARFRYRGAARSWLTAGGSLALQTSLGVLKDAPPVSYQQVDGHRVPVPSRYVLAGGTGRFGIEAPRGYDHGRPLVV